MDKASSKREKMAIPSAIPFSNLSNESISEMSERKIVDKIKISHLFLLPID